MTTSLTDTLKLIIGMLEEELRLLELENSKPYPSHSNLLVSKARLKVATGLMLEMTRNLG